MPEAVLKGRVALVTGVSRRKEIGKVIAQQLAMLGADVFILRMGMKEDKVNLIWIT